MEDVERPVTISPRFWHGRRVLVTGHTGFKGVWLSLWLQHLGAEVTGLALPPDRSPNLFDAVGLADIVTSVFQDVRDGDSVARAVAAARPEIVIHMAAQPLVLASYADPVGTYATNVMGTVNVLEACRSLEGLRAVVNVTTDKCYENRDWVWGYREDEAMGGHDPYSSSKGCSELVTTAYRRSFFAAKGVPIASARAGNVIGGGDWAADRIVPDTLRAFEAGEPVFLRRPDATRPWQHVLEPLSGYLCLAERLCGTDGDSFASGWNFGPEDRGVRTVRYVVGELARRWGEGARWQVGTEQFPHEATLLMLDIAKARTLLGWTPRWELQTTFDMIHFWHRGWLDGNAARDLCLAQIEAYQSHVATPAVRGEAGAV